MSFGSLPDAPPVVASPPEGTVFTPVDFCHNHLLSTIYNFLIHSWNSWGEAKVRELCRLGDMIVANYDQPLAIVDLTQDEDDQDNQQNLEQDQVAEWVVVDELQEEDLPEPDGALNQEGDEMLFAFDHLMGDLDSDESESDAWTKFHDSVLMTSESKDSGVEL
jgi:hypothetical protein